MRLFNSGLSHAYKPQGRVLEIGPGPAPSPDAQVYLDISQSYLDKLPGKEVVQGNANQLPFPDQSFDYIIAMHIAEHIPVAELPQFFSEIARVGKAGYIEVPSMYHELLVNSDTAFLDFGREDVPYDPHQTYWFYDGTTVHIINKSTGDNREHHLLRYIFHHIIKPTPIVAEHIDLFMVGFAWETKVKYQLHDSLADVPEPVFKQMLDFVATKAHKPSLQSLWSELLIGLRAKFL